MALVLVLKIEPDGKQDETEAAVLDQVATTAGKALLTSLFHCKPEKSEAQIKF